MKHLKTLNEKINENLEEKNLNIVFNYIKKNINKYEIDYDYEYGHTIEIKFRESSMKIHSIELERGIFGKFVVTLIYDSSEIETEIEYPANRENKKKFKILMKLIERGGTEIVDDVINDIGKDMNIPTEPTKTNNYYNDKPNIKPKTNKTKKIFGKFFD
jgi:hypothetical protein